MGKSYVTCYKCNKIIERGTICECKKKVDKDSLQRRKEYLKKYNEENEESIKPIKTVAWRNFRLQIINRDGGYCQRCKVKFDLINSSNLEVHHIKSRRDYPDLIFEPDNCITLCELCNNELGTSNELDFEPDSRTQKEIEYNI